MGIKIALCDDDAVQREYINAVLNAYPAGLSVRVFDSGHALLKHANGFDLYLLDILMPGIDGIALARSLREREPDAPIIFLTSSADYALEAFSVSAFQYLLKPVSSEALYAALDKIIAAFDKGDGFIMVQTRDHMRRVPFANIVFVELWGRGLKFTLTDGETLESRAVRMSFASAVGPLLANERFLHAHKSYVLNMEQINQLRARSFIMADGTEIPVPRYKYTEAKNRYFDYLSARGIGLVRHAD